MKNTKHTEMNDSSIEQDNQENLSQSKRKILTSIGVTSGVVGASALVPSTWVKPAVNSVIVPAHAQMTGDMMTSTTPDPDMMTSTTPEPAPMPAIVLSTMAITLTEGADIEVGDDRRTATYTVSLSTMLAGDDEDVVVNLSAPENESNISITSDGTTTITPLTFTVEDQMAKDVVVTALEISPATADNDGGDEITIIHTADDYTLDRAFVTVTVVDEDIFQGTLANPTIKNGADLLTAAEANALDRDNLEPGELLVNWVHTNGDATSRYVVQVQETDNPVPMVEGTYGNGVMTSGILSLKKGTEYEVTVIAYFANETFISSNFTKSTTDDPAS